MKDESEHDNLSPIKQRNKIARGALSTLGGIPVVGGLFSAIAGAWSEKEQEEANNCFEHWIKMLQDELKEKEQTIIEILARLDLQDEKVKQRVKSAEYQSLVKKTFRDWSGAESEKKRQHIRNILSNAAASDLTSDDVIRLFLDWLKQYSELHFLVIAEVYKTKGINRGEIWRKIGKNPVQEDSADADLYKLLIRDLSTGGIIRQHREKDYYGNFISKPTGKRRSKGSGPKPMTSAFDEEEPYELTELGQHFVHYAMTELPPRIEYKENLKDDMED